MKTFEKVTLIISTESRNCSQKCTPSDVLKEQLDDLADDANVEILEILDKEPMELVPYARAAIPHE